MVGPEVRPKLATGAENGDMTTTASGRRSRRDGPGELAELLVAWRGRLRPADVGYVAGSNRKVPGLRREEVAILADVSTDYLERLERGGR